MTTQNELEKVLEEKFLTPIKFSYIIENIVLNEKLNYIDAIIHYCEKESIEVESVSKLMTKPLKEKLKVDATNLNFMKNVGASKAKLPL
jgi:DNA-directed RNA polymerase alpha subunit